MNITDLLTSQFIAGMFLAAWVVAGVMTLVKLRKYFKSKQCKHEATMNLDSTGEKICYDCKKEV